MGLLSQDQVDAINQQFSGAASSSPSESTEATPAPAEASASPAPSPSDSPAPQGVKGAETTQESGEVSQKVQASDKASKKKTAPGQKVPYGRFKNVVEARNSYKHQTDRLRSEMASRDAQIAKLQQQLESAARLPVSPQPATPQVATAPQKTQESSWLDDVLGSSESETDEVSKFRELQESFQSKLSQQANSFDERMYQYEVGQAQRQLESEISGIVQRYPELNPRDLAQLVINDPSVNLGEAAESYMTYKASLEEQAVARYLKENPHLSEKEKEQVVEAVKEVSEAAAAPTAPPRPAGSKTAMADSVSVNNEQSPMKLKDVKRALQERFKQGNPFSR